MFISMCCTPFSQNLNNLLFHRQYCGIESAAIYNPNRPIFVLCTSPVIFSTKTQSASLAVLRSYANIHFMHLNVEALVKGTIAEDFYRSGQISDSQYPVVHLSDFLRIFVLYKYGGIYLDTDAVVQKDLDVLPANFVGKDAYGGRIDAVNNAVMGFQDQNGHEILELFLKYVSQ